MIGKESNVRRRVWCVLQLEWEVCAVWIYSEMAKVAYKEGQRWRLKSVYTFNQLSSVVCQSRDGPF